MDTSHKYFVLLNDSEKEACLFSINSQFIVLIPDLQKHIFVPIETISIYMVTSSNYNSNTSNYQRTDHRYHTTMAG